MPGSEPLSTNGTPFQVTLEEKPALNAPFRNVPTAQLPQSRLACSPRLPDTATEISAEISVNFGGFGNFGVVRAPAAGAANPASAETRTSAAIREPDAAFPTIRTP